MHADTSGHVLAESVAWLNGAVVAEEDVDRRRAMLGLLAVVPKLTQQPSRAAVQQVARDLQVRQHDVRKKELYDAVLARVRERTDELRKQDQERLPKKPRMSGSGPGAGQEDETSVASGSGATQDSDAAQLAARGVQGSSGAGLAWSGDADTSVAGGSSASSSTVAVQLAARGVQGALIAAPVAGEDAPAVIAGAGGARSSSDAAQLAARGVQGVAAAGAVDEDLERKPRKQEMKRNRGNASDAAQLAEESEGAEVAMAHGGGGSSCCSARAAKRGKVMQRSAEAEEAASTELEVRDEEKLEAGKAWLAEQLASKQVGWYKELQDMIPLLRQRPTGREGQAKVRAMARKLSCKRSGTNIEQLHADCVQQWLARLRSLMTYARAGMGSGRSDACTAQNSDAAQLAARGGHGASAASLTLSGDADTVVAGGSGARSSSHAAQTVARGVRNRQSQWWLEVMRRTSRAVADLERQAPERQDAEEWRRWKSRLQWACGKPKHIGGGSRGSFAPVNTWRAVREWKCEDSAWWHHHQLGMRAEQTRRQHGHAFVHYNACVALAGDIERVFGVAVPEKAGEAIPNAPAEEMPRTLRGFTDAVREMAADSCLPLGVNAKSSRLVRQLACIELLEVSYTDLPLREAALLAVVQEARACRRNAALVPAVASESRAASGTQASGALQPTVLPVTGEAVVAQLMAYAQKQDHLEINAAFLNIKGQKEAEQSQALQALVEEAFVAMLTEGTASKAMDVRQVASCVAYYGHLQKTKSQGRLRTWTTWMLHRRSYIAVDAVSTGLPLHAHCSATAWVEKHVPDCVGAGKEAGSASQPPCAMASAIVHPPVMCEICHEGFAGKECLIEHCRVQHGSWAEYRKHVFWKAQQAGLQPLQAWEKRAMVQNFSFFQNFSVPSSGTNEWTRRALTDAVPRVQNACAVCARMEYLEHLFEVYLFAEATGTTSLQRVALGRSARDLDGDGAEAELVEEDENAEWNSGLIHSADKQRKLALWAKGDTLCMAPKEQVHVHLSVDKYSAMFPKIPVAELHGSSIQHPRDASMRWLLHTRRVHTISSAAQPAEGDNGAEGGRPKCAGIGDLEKTCWLCTSCAGHLCNVKRATMPPLALANANWLGREHPLYQNLSLGMRLGLGLGRPMYRKLFLGRGRREESHTGITGNSILMGQPEVEAQDMIPNFDHVATTLAIMFSSDVNDLEHAQILSVERDKFLRCAELRKEVCETFQAVRIDATAAAQLPVNGVPEALVQSAQYVPESEELRVTMDGPAQRQSLFAGDEEAAEVPEEAVEEGAEEEGAHEHADAVVPPATTMIAIDPASEPRPVQLFQAMQTKLQLVHQEAGKLARATARMETCEEGSMAASSGAAQPAAAQADAPSGASQPAGTQADAEEASPASDEADIARVSARTAAVAAQGECKRIVLDVQSIIRQLSKTNKAKLDSIAAGPLTGDALQAFAIAVPTTKPLSIFNAATWSACFTEFFFGDCTPRLERRPVPVSVEELFGALVVREELEYQLEADQDVYKARARSRFDDPEMIAIFGDTLRRMLTLQMVGAAFDRQGFEADVKLIAGLSTDDLVQAAAANTACAGGSAQLGAANDTPDRARAAFRHLMFSTALVPLTDGYRMRLRHLGHSQNVVAGPLLVFATQNHTDTYSPEVHRLHEQSKAEAAAGAAQPGSTERAVREAPMMPTLQRMHEIGAQCPVVTAQFFLLQEELAYRHLYAAGWVAIGKKRFSSLGRCEQEDGWASDGKRGLANWLVTLLKALEAQGRGFTHGHGKYIGHPNGREELQQLLAELDADASQTELEESVEQFNRKLIAAASTMQYECATLPGRQLGEELPAEPFSYKQQRQSKLDGGVELDGCTHRAFLAVTPTEPWGHVAEERLRASAELREPRHPYKELPLTKCQLSLYPAYRRESQWYLVAVYALYAYI